MIQTHDYEAQNTPNHRIPKPKITKNRLRKRNRGAPSRHQQSPQTPTTQINHQARKNRPTETEKEGSFRLYNRSKTVSQDAKNPSSDPPTIASGLRLRVREKLPEGNRKERGLGSRVTRKEGPLYSAGPLRKETKASPGMESKAGLRRRQQKSKKIPLKRRRWR